MQSNDILAVQQSFLQNNSLLPQLQLTEFSSEEVHDQIQLMESVETFNFDKIEDQNDYYNPISKLPQKKPRKRRRRQIVHDKRRKRTSQKLINRKHVSIPFNYEEDRQILLKVLELGPKFQRIAKEFPGRTLCMVKNRYYKFLRFQWDVILGRAYQHLNVQIGQLENQQNIGNMQEENYDVYSQFLF